MIVLVKWYRGLRRSKEGSGAHPTASVQVAHRLVATHPGNFADERHDVRRSNRAVETEFAFADRINQIFRADNISTSSSRFLCFRSAREHCYNHFLACSVRKRGYASNRQVRLSRVNAELNLQIDALIIRPGTKSAYNPHGFVQVKCWTSPNFDDLLHGFPFFLSFRLR